MRKIKPFKADKTQLLLELPPYRFPTLRMLWISMWTRTRAFIIKAGTVIALSMVLLWGVINLPPNTTPQNSFLGKTARAIAPIFQPAGFGKWQVVAAIIPSMIAKETVVGALAQMLNINSKENTSRANTAFIEDTKKQIVSLKSAIIESLKNMFGSLSQHTFELESTPRDYKTKISSILTPLQAYAFMVSMLLFIPCIVTLAAIYQEFGIKMVFFEVILLTAIPYIASVIIYRMGSTISVLLR